ncbi:MAG TPA: hypothetical protein VHV78_15220 [Gemmatimonadaceae bacterium]|jgi:hypothetical protein|nr:hypothetical protein [Gemmatimonadaceae bacterium]
MFLIHVLSQLAILGATSIALRDGGVVPLADAEHLLAIVEPCRRFRLRARESHVDVVDESGRLFGHALTLWRADDRRAFEQGDVQILASR